MEDRTERRRRRLEQDIERARRRLEATRREDYSSDAVYRRVCTQRRQRLARLERLRATLEATTQTAPAQMAAPKGRRGCPRCGEPKSQLFGLAGTPVALCYACWVDLGNEWWQRHVQSTDVNRVAARVTKTGRLVAAVPIPLPVEPDEA